MIPSISIPQNFTVVTQPSYTYAMDLENQVIRGYVDNLEAMKQAIYKILSTSRFLELIYSWNYGAELDGLLGRSKDYIYSELRIRIKEALLADDRIMDVHTFSFSSYRNTISVTFIAETIVGDITATKEVKI